MHTYFCLCNMVNMAGRRRLQHYKIHALAVLDFKNTC